MKYLIFFLLLPGILFAREINPDAIYFKPTSRSFEQLTSEKLQQLSACGAHLADSDCAFFGWMDSQTLFYVKEFEKSNSFNLYLYNTITRKRTELLKTYGFPVAAKCGNGFIFIKRITGKTSFSSEILIINTKTGARNSISRDNLLADFSITPSGLLILEKNIGIVAYNPDTGKDALLVPIESYQSLRLAGATTIAYLSPSGRFTAVLSGGGGNYNCGIFSSGRLIKRIPDVSSASESAWLNDSNFIYRKGSVGNFDISIIEPATGKTTSLGISSLNTALSLSESRGIIGYAIDGTAALYFSEKKENEILPFDGEEILFTPRGDRFGILYAKRLFVLNYSSVSKAQTYRTKSLDTLRRIYQEASKKSSDWDNSYSGEYIARKLKFINAQQGK